MESAFGLLPSQARTRHRRFAQAPLVDKISRNQLAKLLDDLAAGRISIAELRAQAPRSADRAVREVIGQASLLDAEALDGAARLRGEDRGEVLRWALFLRSSLEYGWPVLPAWLRIVGIIPSILTFGLIWRPYRRWFEGKGDYRVWPFLDSGEYNDARRAR